MKISARAFNFKSRWPGSSGGGLQKCLRTATKRLLRFQHGILTSIGIERYTHGGRVQTPSKPEYRARYPDARPIFATRTPVPVRASQT